MIQPPDRKTMLETIERRPSIFEVALSALAYNIGAGVSGILENREHEIMANEMFRRIASIANMSEEIAERDGYVCMASRAAPMVEQ
jgi:hypothetical protein